METNLDSVLDRIRVLEQKIDEHPVQQVIVQSTGMGEGSAEQPKPAERHHRKQHRKICKRSWQAGR